MTGEDRKTLHMLSLWLDQRRLFELGKMLRLPLKRTDSDYLVHCALGELFQDNAPSTYGIERATGQDRSLHVLAYSELDLDALQRISQAFASPKVYSILDWERSSDKPMPTEFPAGMKVGFELRFCPIIRLSSSCEGGGRTYKKGSELDAYQAAQLRAGGDESLDRAQVYRTWLDARLSREEVARISSATLDGFSLERMLRRTQGSDRKARVITRPVASMSGALEILDSAGFAALLSRGIGRHRGFGLGMLKLRRAR